MIEKKYDLKHHFKNCRHYSSQNYSTLECCMINLQLDFYTKTILMQDYCKKNDALPVRCQKFKLVSLNNFSSYFKASFCYSTFLSTFSNNVNHCNMWFYHLSEYIIPSKFFCLCACSKEHFFQYGYDSLILFKGIEGVDNLK